MSRTLILSPHNGHNKEAKLSAKDTERLRRRCLHSQHPHHGPWARALPELGISDQRILEVIQGLTQDDLIAAWDYYACHPAEIEEAIRHNEEA